MKLLNIFLLCFLISACAGNNDKTISPQTVKAQGGVDIGNMSSSAVPQTNAYFDVLGSWTSKIEGNLLILENASFSKIEASKANLEGLNSLDVEDIKVHLEIKFPNRTYNLININGLKGVRAELTETDSTRTSDIYLISEDKDLIHIVSHLNNSDDGIAEGEQIISTVKVKFKGVAYKSSPVKTIDLSHQEDEKVYRYSLTQDCWESETCTGSIIQIKDYILSVKGNIVELGPEMTFDAIKVEGEFLVAPNSKFPISDIYADDRGQSVLRMKSEFVYLIRIDEGPEQGLIIKLEVTGELLSQNTKIKFQKLVAVKPESKP